MPRSSSLGSNRPAREITIASTAFADLLLDDEVAEGSTLHVGSPERLGVCESRGAVVLNGELSRHVGAGAISIGVRTFGRGAYLSSCELRGLQLAWGWAKKKRAATGGAARSCSSLFSIYAATSGDLSSSGVTGTSGVFFARLSLLPRRSRR